MFWLTSAHQPELDPFWIRKWTDQVVDFEIQARIYVIFNPISEVSGAIMEGEVLIF